MIVFDSVPPIVTVGVARRERARPCVLVVIVKGAESLYIRLLLGLSVGLVSGNFGFASIVSFCMS